MRSMAKNWISLVIGAWILISPWLLGYSGMSLMKWSDVLCGLALVVMNAWVLFEKYEK